MTLKVISYGKQAQAAKPGETEVALQERLRAVGLDAQADALASGDQDLLERADATYESTNDLSWTVIGNRRSGVELENFTSAEGIPLDALALIEAATLAKLFKQLTVHADASSLNGAKAFTIVGEAVDAFRRQQHYVIVRWGDDIESIGEVLVRRRAEDVERERAYQACVAQLQLRSQIFGLLGMVATIAFFVVILIFHQALGWWLLVPAAISGFITSMYQSRRREVEYSHRERSRGVIYDDDEYGD